MLSDKRNNLWCECKMSLGNEADSACLIIDYRQGSKSKEMKLMMSDITCVRRIYDKTCTNCFAIHTALRTMERNSLLFSASSEKEVNDWITSLTASCQQARKCEGPPKASALWCTTLWGDVFFSDSKDESGELRYTDSLKVVLLKSFGIETGLNSRRESDLLIRDKLCDFPVWCS